jgi:hypothetical protein
VPGGASSGSFVWLMTVVHRSKTEGSAQCVIDTILWVYLPNFLPKP